MHINCSAFGTGFILLKIWSTLLLFTWQKILLFTLIYGLHKLLIRFWFKIKHFFPLRVFFCIFGNEGTLIHPLSFREWLFRNDTETSLASSSSTQWYVLFLSWLCGSIYCSFYTVNIHSLCNFYTCMLLF